MTKIGSTTYTYTIDDLRKLEALVKANKSSVKALSIWHSCHHPCDVRELLECWGYWADRFLRGDTVDQVLAESVRNSAMSDGKP